VCLLFFTKFLKLKEYACDITMIPEFCVSVLNSDKLELFSINIAYVGTSKPKLNFLKLPIETWQNARHYVMIVLLFKVLQ